MTPDEVLEKARRVLYDLQQLFPDEGGNWEAEEVLQALIALAEHLQEALVEERYQYLDSLDPAYYPNGDRPDYRAQARKELSIEKRSRFTAEEKEAIGRIIIDLDRYLEDHTRIFNAQDIAVLREMLEE